MTYEEERWSLTRQGREFLAGAAVAADPNGERTRHGRFDDEVLHEVTLPHLILRVRLAAAADHRFGRAAATWLSAVETGGQGRGAGSEGERAKLLRRARG
jgi:hypothetical protein